MQTNIHINTDKKDNRRPFWKLFLYYILSGIIIFTFVSIGILFKNNDVNDDHKTHYSLKGEGVYRIDHFEKDVITDSQPVFIADVLETKDGYGELSIEDFSRIRLAQNTTASITGLEVPEIQLEGGEIWVSTKDIVTTSLPRASVSTAFGKALFSIREDGLVTVHSWEKPSYIRFFAEDQETEILSFYLPTKHRLQYYPDSLPSQNIIDALRFSKIKNELRVTKVSTPTEWIKENIGKDAAWEMNVRKSILSRKSQFYSKSLAASIFNIMPKKKDAIEEDDKNQQRRDIWFSFSEEDFLSAYTTLTKSTLSDDEKRRFALYASFYVSDKQAFKLFEDSFHPLVNEQWRKFITLEEIVTIPDTDNKRRVFLGDILSGLQVSNDVNELEGYSFLASSLFQNYPSFIKRDVTQFLFQINDRLIDIEKTKDLATTRRAEIAQNILVFANDLMIKQEYDLALDMLNEISDYLEIDPNPKLEKQKSEILVRKKEIETKAALAKELGANVSEEEIQQYLKNKAIIENISNQFHTAAFEVDEGFSLEKTREFFQLYSLTGGEVSQSDNIPYVFNLNRLRNRYLLEFSGEYDARDNSFRRLSFHLEDGHILDELDNEVFLANEIAKLKKQKLLEGLSHYQEGSDTSSLTDAEIASRNKKIIPAAIIDGVLNISKDYFYRQGIKVESSDMEVTSSNTIKVEYAVPFYKQMEDYKEIKKDVYRNGDEYAIEAFEQLKDYKEIEVSFELDINTKKVLSAEGKKKDVVVYIKKPTDFSAAMEYLHDKIIDKEEVQIKIDKARSQFSSGGFKPSVATFIYDEENDLITFLHLEHPKTSLIFAGIYDPEKRILNELELELPTGNQKFGEMVELIQLIESIRTYEKQLEEEEKQFEDLD